MYGILEAHFLKLSRGSIPSNPLEARVLSARGGGYAAHKISRFLVDRVEIYVPQAPHAI